MILILFKFIVVIILNIGQNGDATKINANDYCRFSNSGFYTKQTSPFPFITYSEVKLIEAEARLRSVIFDAGNPNQWIMGMVYEQLGKIPSLDPIMVGC